MKISADYLLPPANAVAKVMFSVMSVCSQEGPHHTRFGHSPPLYRIRALVPLPPLYRVPTPPWTNSQYMKYKKVPVQPPDMLKLVQVGPHCTVGKTVGWHSPEIAVLFLLLQQVPSPHKSANVTSSQTFLLNFAESFKPRAEIFKQANCMRWQCRLHENIDRLITTRKRSCGKVIFSQACVIPSVHEGGGVAVYASQYAMGCGVVFYWVLFLHTLTNR